VRGSISPGIIVRMTANAPRAEVVVGILASPKSRERGLVDRLTRLINDVFRTAESGLWRNGAERTTPSELAELIAARQVAVARREGAIAGCVRIHDVAEDASEFGMLAADPDHRGTGVGRALVDFAEQHSRERGLRAMQLELLVPRDWLHPSKEFLKSWYARMAYRPISTRPFDDLYPHLAPLLATPCELAVYEKSLRPATNCDPPSDWATPSFRRRK
jgi:GNAT superfamily N-acetyltransferase